MERGTKQAHAFIEANKWLYASKADLESAYDRLDRQIAIQSGMVESLDDDADAEAETGGRPGATTGAQAARSR